MNARIRLVILMLVLYNLTGCISVANIRRGVVVDKETGHPVEGVVLVRSWDRVTAHVAGHNSDLLAYGETKSNKNGKYLFMPRILFTLGSIPILTFSWIKSLQVSGLDFWHLVLALRDRTKLTVCYC